jgi:hypothetical protein
MMRTAALASPLIWFANHTAQFALAPLACLWHSNLVLWIVAAAALLLDSACGVVAWSAWQKGADQGAAPMPPWLAMSGVMLSASFFVVIAAQMIPILMLAGCE